MLLKPIQFEGRMRQEKRQEILRMRKLNLDRIMKAVEVDDNRGFCVSCGAEAFGVEPDARRYKCEECGEDKVYGAEELLLMFV